MAKSSHLSAITGVHSFLFIHDKSKNDYVVHERKNNIYVSPITSAWMEVIAIPFKYILLILDRKSFQF